MYEKEQRRFTDVERSASITSCGTVDHQAKNTQDKDHHLHQPIYFCYSYEMNSTFCILDRNSSTNIIPRSSSIFILCATRAFALVTIIGGVLPRQRDFIQVKLIDLFHSCLLFYLTMTSTISERKHSPEQQ